MEFHVSTKRSVRVTSKVPAQYRHQRMAGAEVQYGKNGSGDFLVQIIGGSGFQIQYNTFNMAKNRCLFPYNDKDLITMHFMLQGTTQCQIQGLGTIRLKEGLFHLFYIPGGKHHRAWLTPGTFHSLQIDLSPKFLRALAGKYQELKELMDHLSLHSPKGVQQHEAPITNRIKIIVNELFVAPLEEPDRSFFLEIRIKELLLFYVKGKVVGLPMTIPNADQLDMLQSFIFSHLDQPHTIVSLAARTLTSEISLRRRFKEYFGESLHQMLIKYRMETAMDLLSHTELSIGAIANQVGYRDFSSFTRAFKRYYGYPPNHVRDH